MNGFIIPLVYENAIKGFSFYYFSEKLGSMRILKKILTGLLIFLVLAVLGLWATGNQHMLRGLRSTYLIGKSKPDIDDMAYFDLSVIKADKPEAWPKHANFGKLAISEDQKKYLDSFQTTAFLVFQHDSLLLENYFENTDSSTVSNSFSMAKSLVGVLIGVAIDEGYIKSVDQPVSDFLPEYKDGLNAKLTIKHLLQMSSGIPFGESYGNPMGYMAKAYFGDNLIEITKPYKVTIEPGSGWIYEGGNTVLLGEILIKATGRSVSDYFHQKIWSCIGAEHDAYWNLDREGGMEKVFSGFYATARDFARMGMLFEHNGILGPDTLVSPEYVKASLTPCMNPDISPVKQKVENCYWYGYQWWMGDCDGHPFYCMKGLRGQYVVVVPDFDIIVVRMGHEQSKEREKHHPVDLFEYVRTAISLVD
jgi:CubicO group peptidase (beta-lactamase class C family)